MDPPKTEFMRMPAKRVFSRVAGAGVAHDEVELLEVFLDTGEAGRGLRFPVFGFHVNGRECPEELRDEIDQASCSCSPRRQSPVVPR